MCGSGADGVYSDIVRAKFLCERERKSDQAPFRCRIWRPQWVSHFSCNRRNIDDRPCLAFDHRGNDTLAEKKWRSKIDIKRPVPILDRNFVGGKRWARNSGIV